MERKLGEVFNFNGVTLQVQRRIIPFSCAYCYFNTVAGFCYNMNCFPSERIENERVILVKIKGSELQ